MTTTSFKDLRDTLKDSFEGIKERIEEEISPEQEVEEIVILQEILTEELDRFSQNNDTPAVGIVSSDYKAYVKTGTFAINIYFKKGSIPVNGVLKAAAKSLIRVDIRRELDKAATNHGVQTPLECGGAARHLTRSQSIRRDI